MNCRHVYSAGTKAAVALTVCFFVFVSLPPAQGAVLPISVFGTGVDASGNLLGDTLVDPHYTISDSEVTNAPAYLIVGASAEYVAAFNADVNHKDKIDVGWPRTPGTYVSSSTNKWIAPRSDVLNIISTGTYTYTTTFDLSDFDASTVVLTGRFSADNYSGGVFLNGNLIPGTTTTDIYTFQKFISLNLTGIFLPGLNTLQFVVINSATPDPNPTGLLVELSGTAVFLPKPPDPAPSPEPGTVLLLAGGLVVMAGLRYRRTR